MKRKTIYFTAPHQVELHEESLPALGTDGVLVETIWRRAYEVNAAMLSIAMQAGATCSITDPIKLGSTIKANDLLLGKDANSMRYLKYFRATEKLREAEAAVK